MATEKWDEVELDLDPKTFSDVVDERTESQMKKSEIAKVEKEETSKASKLIHASGGETAVLDAIIGGETVRSLCSRMGFSVAAFQRWVDRGGEARRSAVARARAAAAHSLVDESLAIADETQYAESNVQVQSARLRADMRWKAAAAWNKEAYGQAQSEININLGDIALSALRKRTVRDVTDVDPTDD